MRIAVLGEDRSDASTVSVLIRRLNDRLIANPPRGGASQFRSRKQLQIKPKNYGGWSHICRKGARDLVTLAKLGYERFVICVDADNASDKQRRLDVEAKVIKKANLSLPTCLVIPVQELEAWILADIEEAAPKVILSWRPAAITSPERVASPKEYLRRLSEDPVKRKARYSETHHNERLAKYLRLEQIESKCPSFQKLVEFVNG